MKNFERHFKTLKDILLDESSDTVALMKNYDKEVNRITADTDILDFEDSDRDIISALTYKISRLKGWHPNYKRDEETNLTLGTDGFSIWDYQDPWENASDEEIYKPLTYFMKPLFYKGTDSSIDNALLTDHKNHSIAPANQQKFAEDLTEATHRIVNYISDNVKRNWAWRKDMYAFSIYTFEFFFEYVYNLVIKKKPVSLSNFKPEKLFTYPIKDLSVDAEQYMLRKEDRLNDILDSTFNFMEMNGYHLSRNPIWMRSILFQVGLGSLKVVLESENI